jgi:hypothetical protein
MRAINDLWLWNGSTQLIAVDQLSAPAVSSGGANVWTTFSYPALQKAGVKAMVRAWSPTCCKDTNQLSDSAIAAEVGIQKITIERWKRIPEFRFRVHEHLAEARKAMLKHTITETENQICVFGVADGGNARGGPCDRQAQHGRAW